MRPSPRQVLLQHQNGEHKRHQRCDQWIERLHSITFLSGRHSSRKAASSPGAKGVCPLRIAGLPLRTNRLFSRSINKVKQRQNRMPVEHARTGVPHHGPDLLPHNGHITMHRAPGARRLVLLERAFVETLLGMVQKFPTFKAQFALVFVLAVTIEVYHHLNGLAFPCHSGVLVRHRCDLYFTAPGSLSCSRT